MRLVFDPAAGRPTHASADKQAMSDARAAHQAVGPAGFGSVSCFADAQASYAQPESHSKQLHAAAADFYGGEECGVRLL